MHKKTLLLISLLGIGLLLGDTRVSSRELFIPTYQVSILTFKELHGRLPTLKEGLEVLYERPKAWSEPKEWVQITTMPPFDTWGNPLQYIQDPKLKDGWGIYSLGEDGKSTSQGNDPDDINSWNHASSRRHYQIAENRHHYIRYAIYALITVVVVLGAVTVKRHLTRQSH